MSEFTQLQHLVVGVDGSDGGRTALDWASALGTTSRLTVVHALSPTVELFAGAAQIDFDPVRAEHQRLLDSVWTDSARTRGITFDTTLLDDEPAAALRFVAAHESADAIVIGHQGHGRWSQHHVGDVAGRLLHHCSLPLILTNGTADARPLTRTIVVGLSRPADRENPELTWALSVARHWGLQVHLVSLVEYLPRSDDNFTFDMPNLHAEMSRQLEALSKQVRSHVPGLDITCSVRDGDAAAGLAHVAKDVDACMVVVGTHHPGPISGFFAGSVARVLPPLLNCPMAAIPAL